MSDREDITLDHASLFGSAQWVAMTLGLSVGQFRSRRTELVLQGFPRPDHITGTYIKDDVIEWVNQRRQIKNNVTMPSRNQPRGPRTDAI